MKRREFLSMVSAMGLAPAVPAAASPREPTFAEIIEELEGDLDINPYFLESGNISEEEQLEIEDYIGFQQELSQGSPVRHRGRPKRAPTFRMLQWQGELGDPPGNFVSPLSVRSDSGCTAPYQLNAQILNFNPCTEDWSHDQETGALTVELRAISHDAPKTWIHMQSFEVHDKKTATIESEYLAHREGIPEPLVTDKPNVGIRVQLVRTRKKGNFLSKVFTVTRLMIGSAASAWAGGAAGFGVLLGGIKESLPEVLPSFSAPEMPEAGRALTQALVGTNVQKNEVPIWSSGFAAYGLGEGGSRLRLQSGLWVIMDESRQVDLREVQLVERDIGRPTLVCGGRPCDLNYLVLALETGSA